MLRGGKEAGVVFVGFGDDFEAPVIAEGRIVSSSFSCRTYTRMVSPGFTRCRRFLFRLGTPQMRFLSRILALSRFEEAIQWGIVSGYYRARYKA